MPATNRSCLSVAVRVLARQIGRGLFIPSPLRGRCGLLRWILSCGTKLHTFAQLVNLLRPNTQFFAVSHSLPWYKVFPVLAFVALILQFTEERISPKLDTEEELRAMLLQSVPGICGVQAIRTCALFVALADSESQLKASMNVLFGIDCSKESEQHQCWWWSPLRNLTVRNGSSSAPAKH